MKSFEISFPGEKFCRNFHIGLRSAHVHRAVDGYYLYLDTVQNDHSTLGHDNCVPEPRGPEHFKYRPIFFLTKIRNERF